MITGQDIGNAAAQALVGGNRATFDSYANQVSAERLPELRGAIDRASEAHKNLLDLCATLTRHVDRILGPQPECDTLAKVGGVGTDSEMSGLRNELTGIEETAYRIRNQVERLARL